MVGDRGVVFRCLSRGPGIQRYENLAEITAGKMKQIRKNKDIGLNYPSNRKLPCQLPGSFSIIILVVISRQAVSSDYLNQFDFEGE